VLTPAVYIAHRRQYVVPFTESRHTSQTLRSHFVQVPTDGWVGCTWHPKC